MKRKYFRYGQILFPLIVQTLLQESLSQDDLQRLLENKLDDYKDSGNSNQYILMIIYLLIIDLDPIRNIDRIDEAIERINLGILENTLLVKLYTYLMFQSYGKEDFENSIRDKIRKLTIKIDPSANRGAIDKHLESLTKVALIDNARS